MFPQLGYLTSMSCSQLISVHTHTSVHLPSFTTSPPPQFPSKCYNTVHGSLSVCWLVPYCSSVSTGNADITRYNVSWYCWQSVSAVWYIRFVTPDPVLLLFHSPFLSTDFPSTAHKNVSSSLILCCCYSTIRFCLQTPSRQPIRMYLLQ